MDVRHRGRSGGAAGLAAAALLAACTTTAGPPDVTGVVDRVAVWVAGPCGESDPLSCDVVLVRVAG